MYDHILVPVDGSPVAETVLPLAGSLARNLGARVTLLHVIEARNAGPDAMAGLRERATVYLDALARGLTSTGAAATAIAVGNAADEILRAAQEGNYELIAMGTSGERALGGFYFGSVAWSVLHRSTAPLLLVRPTGPDPAGSVPQRIRRVLVPLDGSPTAEAVLPYAESLAAVFHADLYLVRVVPSPVMLTSPGAGATLAPFQRDLLQQAQEYLDSLVQRIGPRSFRVSSVALTGPVAAQIVELARQVEDSMVAMATHGRTGVPGLLLGSVAAQVAQHSGDPVLLVRPGATPS